MGTLTTDLPDDIYASVAARAALGGFARVEDYLRAIIVAGLGEPISKELEEKLLEGLDSPSREMTPADWEAKKRELIEWHGKCNA